MPVHVERNRPESYTLRLLGEGKAYGEKYILSLTVDCDETECEIKALDHPINRVQRCEIEVAVKQKASGRIIYSMRRGRRVEYK